MTDAPDPAELRLHQHQLRTMGDMLLAEQNQYHAYITEELHKPHRRRVVWEVYTGLGRVSAIPESLGAEIEVFSLETGWNFGEPSHRRQFLARLDAEVPGELWPAPVHKYWSPMQSLAARTAEQQEVLQGLRDWHHSTHVMFTKKAFETQVKNGAHAHINLLAHSPGARRPSPSCLASRHVLISAVMVPNAVTLMVNGSQPRNRLAC